MPKRQQKPHERIAEVKRRALAGPIILQHSFRPFFLAAGVWATLAVPFWLFSYTGYLNLPDAFDSYLWHTHEMLFGFAGAAMAGFILTAIPNWTGRLPVSGWRLGVLVSLWAAGRLGFLAAGTLEPLVISALDLSFLTLLVLLIARELVSGKNWRNLPVLILFAFFAGGNWLIHLELNAIADTADLGLQLSTFVLAILMAVIGGRVVPSFTRNWLVQRGEKSLPAPPMGHFDLATLALLVIFVVSQVLAPGHAVTSYLALAAGTAHAVRLTRWKVWLVLTEPLMWVLHLGYGWLVVALVLTGLSGLTDAVPNTAAVHALTTGAFSTMILAVMTRASLGHSGRALKASKGTTMIFLGITVAAVLRVGAPFLEGQRLDLIWISGIAWTVAFGLFTVLYFPVFIQSRLASPQPSPPPPKPAA